jgi:acyl-coenzyme A synthetase/AMP-(fatty) acid ligase
VFDKRDLALHGPVSREIWHGVPTLSYPNRPGSILDVLDWGVRRTPDLVLFVEPNGSETTYAGFAGLVETTAAWLQEQGVRPGEAIAAAAVNSTPLAALIFAGARIGAIVLCLPARLDPEAWAYMLTDAPCTFTVADLPRLAPLRAAAHAAGVQRPVELRSLSGGRGGWAYDPARDCPPEDATYAVAYTSGTTGRPKATQMVHRCSVHSAMTYQRILQLQPMERTAVAFPLGHASALHGHLLAAMLAGATCVLLDTAGPRRFLRVLSTERIAWACAPPPTWQLVVKEAGCFADALTHLRILGSTGAPYPDLLAAALHARVPHVRLLNLYGTCETHALATMLDDHQLVVRGGAAGRVLPCMEVTIRDRDGADLPPGEIGEVWLRGSLVTTGYAGDPKSSEQAIVDGWFATGDAGQLDEAGYLSLVNHATAAATPAAGFS